MQDKNYIRQGTGFLQNTNLKALEAYKAKKQQSSKIDEVYNDINSLKEELSDIKEALKILIDSKK